jgi:hypothetical protein
MLTKESIYTKKGNSYFLENIGRTGKTTKKKRISKIEFEAAIKFASENKEKFLEVTINENELYYSEAI